MLRVLGLVKLRDLVLIQPQRRRQDLARVLADGRPALQAHGHAGQAPEGPAWPAPRTARQTRPARRLTGPAGRGGRSSLTQSWTPAGLDSIGGGALLPDHREASPRARGGSN